MPAVAERDVFADRLGQIIERLADNLAAIAPAHVDTKVLANGNTPAMIAGHAAGAIRGAVLGIGCGQEVTRDRESEFTSSGGSPEALAESMRMLGGEVRGALLGTADGLFDEVIVPPQSWLGLVPQQEMARRAAIISAIAHASEHLGELMFIKDTLAAHSDA